MRHRSALLLAVLATVCVAPFADAGHRTISKSYSVLLPLPYDSKAQSHCASSTEGLSRHTEQFRAPARGVLEVHLAGFLGGWVVELYDARGVMVAQGAEWDPTNTAPDRAVKYKPRAGETLSIAVCNVVGTPAANVRYTFTFAH